MVQSINGKDETETTSGHIGFRPPSESVSSSAFGSCEFSRIWRRCLWRRRVRGATTTPTPTETETATPTSTPTPTPTAAPSGSGAGGAGGADDTGETSPDISVVSADLNTTEITAGDAVDASAVVRNGGSASGSIEVRLTIDGEFSGQRIVQVQSGEQRTVSFDRQFDEPGIYTIDVNDARAGTLTVNPTPTPMPTPTPTPTPTQSSPTPKSVTRSTTPEASPDLPVDFDADLQTFVKNVDSEGRLGGAVAILAGGVLGGYALLRRGAPTRFLPPLPFRQTHPEPVLLALDPLADECDVDECHLWMLADENGKAEPVVLQNWQIPYLPDDVVIQILGQPGCQQIAGHRIPLLKGKIEGRGDSSGLSPRERRLSKELASRHLSYAEPDEELVESAVKRFYD